MSSVNASNWRLVEVGRVVLVNNKQLATIVEIVDQKRVLIDGPTTGVPRQLTTLARVVLTPLVVDKLPRGSKSITVAKKFTASEISSKWEASSWGKKAQRQKRSELSDFERFQVVVLKKQRRYTVKKAAAKA